TAQPRQAVAVRHPGRVGLDVRRAVAQELVEAVLAAALDQMAVRPRAPEEEQLAADTGVVDGDDGVDSGAGGQPPPRPPPPHTTQSSRWPLVVGRWPSSAPNGTSMICARVSLYSSRCLAKATMSRSASPSARRMRHRSACRWTRWRIDGRRPYISRSSRRT